MTYTFDDSLISDLHKDAYGFRPRADFFLVWDTLSDDERQVIWDRLCVTVEDSIDNDRQQQVAAIASFEAELTANMAFGAKDRSTAFRWMVDAYDANHEINGFEAGMFCYQYNLPYSMEDELKDLYRGNVKASVPEFWEDE